MPVPTEKQIELYRRSFVDWAESEFGFYVSTQWDTNRKRWVNRIAPIRFQEFERTYLKWALTVREDGKLPIDTLCIIDIGQSGKTLKSAAIAQWVGMFIEPDPAARYTEDRLGHPDIVMAANAETQAAVRCFAALRKSIMLHPYSATLFDVQTFSIYFKGTGHLATPVPTKASTQAGTSAVLIAFDELWGLTGESAARFFDEMKLTPARNISFKVVTTYPGHGEEGPLMDIIWRFFDPYMNLKPDVERPVGEDLPFYYKDRVALWWNHDPRYPWHTEEFMRAREEEMRSRPYEFRRIWRAELVSAENAFVSSADWNACSTPEIEPMSAARKEALVGGVDLGVKRSCSAVVWRAYNPHTETYDLRGYRIWEPGDERVLDKVERYIVEVSATHDIIALYIDPMHALQMKPRLQRLGIRVVEVQQGREREMADTLYQELIVERKLRNFIGCAELSDHTLNAVGKHTGRGGIRLIQPSPNIYIDAAVADAMACYGTMRERHRFIARSRPAVYHRKRNIYAEVYS